MEQEALQLWRGAVLPDWLDYNGHMTEHRYLQVFGESSDALYARLGVDFARAAEGAYFTLESHIRHIAETHAGTPLKTTTEVLGYDEKRLHTYHRLFAVDGRLLATGEHLSIHVAQSKACAASAEMLGAIRQLFLQQQLIAPPEHIGSVLKKPLHNSRLVAGG